MFCLTKRANTQKVAKSASLQRTPLSPPSKYAKNMINGSTSPAPLVRNGTWFRLTAGGSGCPSAAIINNTDSCSKAAWHLNLEYVPHDGPGNLDGYWFLKDFEDMPGGCFFRACKYDPHLPCSVYFNDQLDATSTYAKYGGLCYNRATTPPLVDTPQEVLS